MNAILMLEDGFTLRGKAFAGSGEVLGEVVFNTGMTGYQEMVTDPSYKSQILTFTYPLIGNYGCNSKDFESKTARAAAVLVKEYCKVPYSIYAEETFADFLERHDTIGIEGIDTRSLTLHLRRSGTMKGIISTVCFDKEELQAKVDRYPGITGVDLVKEVTTDKRYGWPLPDEGKIFLPKNGSDPAFFRAGKEKPVSTAGKHVVVIDMGVKYSILNGLAMRGCRITVVPSTTAISDIYELKPDGILFSNGPGDPAALDYLLPVVREFLGKLPVMGICLGHQVMGRALGANTFKLNFGHRGGNHPVKDLTSNRVYITSQNHGFCISEDSKLEPGTKITHLNLNDNTVEGLADEKRNFFSVQFHPEAGPGPHDCMNLFDKFAGMM